MTFSVLLTSLLTIAAPQPAAPSTVALDPPPLVTPVVRVTSTTPCAPTSCFADHAGKSFSEVEAKAMLDRRLSDERAFLTGLGGERSAATCAASFAAARAGGFWDLITIVAKRCS